MSLIQKPCPRKRFPCSRCGAKIVNAGLQWEVSVPKYQQWFYMNALTLATNGAATVTPIMVYAPRVLPYHDDETQSQAPCKFDGPYTDEGFQIVGDDTPASGGQWLQDFDWHRFDADLDAWNQFARSHFINVYWEPAIVDDKSGELITPGGWRITLTILQQAIGYTELIVDGGSKFIHQNLAPGATFHNVGNGTGGVGDTDLNDVSEIRHVYYPPAGYNCLSTEPTRWTRPVPTLPVIQNTLHTKATLPAGYTWPASQVGTGPFIVPFYPAGFDGSLNIYLAPPYIDVRHIPR